MFPIETKLARQLMRLPEEVPLILFGTSGANDLPHKGFDLLQSALQHLCGQIEMHLVVFGQLAPENPPDFGFPVHYVGHLYDDLSMQALYSAVDLVAIPSRVDNLPNVGIEAMACGTPVVTFDACGLPDIVKHKETGYLAKAFDTKDFASGVKWVLADKQRHLQLCKQSRQEAEDRFSFPVIASQYQSLYETVIAGS
jgi:glycosyltransferase involved in cell wall biosynthesis